MTAQDSAAKKSYIPINKGHFELDTPERMAAFSKNLGSDGEEAYRQYRAQWESLPKSRKIADYPLLVDLELASICNLKCPMCYTITDAFKGSVKRGLMKWSLFEKVIEEIAGKVHAVRLSLRGEPTLHKRFVDAIALAKSKGIQEVSCLTHGGKLDLEYFTACAEAGIDWITISIDGIGETYDNVRKPLTFDDTIRRLEEIKAYKARHGLVKPVIKVQGIWPAIRPDPTSYYRAIAPLVDLVAFNPLIDYLGKDDEIVFEENFSCPQLYQRVVVGADGRVMMCSNDEDGEVIIGDAETQTIHEIWHGDKLAAMREKQSQKDGFLDIAICRKCYYPRKAVPDEKAMVDGREVWIENYVNRSQEIGS
ncbi:MAG: radical SAM protein [Magnetococcales bacterium]|nr:radical SAM protein [Magnetococcales bacterium]